jgi:hypothetical protein
MMKESIDRAGPKRYDQIPESLTIDPDMMECPLRYRLALIPFFVSRGMFR